MAADPDATKVEWRDWRPESFAAARKAEKPILLALVTTWADECYEMDRGAYADPRIAGNINDSFVPIRVDADRHPRVRERYNMGGFPSTVFLTPDGDILTGATYLGVDGFRPILDSVRRTWEQNGSDAGSVPRVIRDAEPPRGTVDDSIEEHMVEQLLGAYDEEYGGWGTDRKFPMPRTIEFALVRAPDQGIRTLEAIRAHLVDTYDGGFYRFARHRNWRGARLEKLTDENTALIRAFVRGYRYTGEEAFREAAETGADYLTTTLWTGEAFAASQGGDESYFRLESTEREDTTAPAVDETIFADRNGLAIDALLWLTAYTDAEGPRAYARRAMQYVSTTLVDDGCVSHFPAADGENASVERAWQGERGLLLDQARVLTGFTTAWQVLGEAGPAREVADWTLEHLQTTDGALLDGPTGGPGLLADPLYPLDTAVDCADAFLDLALLTGEDRYQTAAREAVSSFAGATDRMGVEVAQFAAVAARLQRPSVIEVGTPAGTALHRAALRLADHETVVVPGADDSDRNPVADEPVRRGEARVVTAGSVEGTASDPAALEAVLTDS